MIGKIRRGLMKTREALTTDIGDLLKRKGPATQEDMENLEEALLMADVGLPTIETLMEDLQREASKNDLELREALHGRMMGLWPPMADEAETEEKPCVLLAVGVNGVGKTTTLGKLAAQRTAAGQRGILAAADTFRAAAVEQLAIWAERSGTDLVHQREGADPAAVAFDAVQAANARKLDFVMVDTAGRLHVKHNLMEELAKIHRVIAKAMPGAPHRTTLVMDATTGQNGLSQARMFTRTVPVTDLILTKLDGAAKGGIALSVASELKIPITFVGVGEKMDDLVPFDAKEYVDGLLLPQ